MQKLIVGSIIGMVIGVLFGASVVAPRLSDAALQRADKDGNTIVAEQISPSKVSEDAKPDAETLVDISTATAIMEPSLVHWNLVSAFPSTLPILGPLSQRLGEQLGQVSNGEISIAIHEPGTLAPASELFEAVRSNAIDAAFTTPALTAQQVPALGLFGAVPFGPSPREMLSWLYVGDGLKHMTAIYHKRDLHAEPCGVVTEEAAGWFKDEVTSVNDLAGLRMRIGGLAARAAGELGIEVVPLEANEIRTALQTGTIDAAQSSLPSIDHALELHTAAKHYYFPGWQQRSTLLTLLVRLDQWEALSESQKSQISAVCGDSVRASLAESEARQFDALKKISGTGAEINRLPSDVLNALSGAWDTVVAAESENDEEFRKVWQSLKSFRRDYDIWDELSSL